MDDYDDEDDLPDYGYDEPDDDDEWECCCPDTCLMQGLHRRDECYTAEWVEEYYRQMEATS